MKTRNHPPLPRRAFNSPTVEFANFKDGTHVNLIRLIKPYANGKSFAVLETTFSPFCKNAMFKDYDKAKRWFEQMVINGTHHAELRNRGLTGN